MSEPRRADLASVWAIRTVAGNTVSPLSKRAYIFLGRTKPSRHPSRPLVLRSPNMSLLLPVSDEERVDDRVAYREGQSTLH